MLKKIHFRPHHFLCTMNFKGKGYSLSFIRNYQKILKRLQSNPKQKIAIVSSTDSICSACPKRQGNQCKDQETSMSFDKRHEKAFHFIPGNAITWKEALLQVHHYLIRSTFNLACEGCPWKKEICEKNFSNLIRKLPHS